MKTSVVLSYPPPSLHGSRVTLRGAQASDKLARLKLGRDAEYHHLVGGDPERADQPLTIEGIEKWYAELTSEPLGWVIEAEAQLIGTTRLHSVDLSNRRARYAIGIYAAKDRGRGYGTEATRLVLDLAFGELGLHRVDLRVLEFNRRAIAAYERCGFVREGIERESALIGGSWHSDLIMSVLEQEYRR